MNANRSDLPGLRRALELLRAAKCDRSVGIIRREIERIERQPIPCRVCGKVEDCALCASARAIRNRFPQETP